MKIRIIAATLAFTGAALAWQPQAQAIGCISGGLAGAVAGHMVHHGVLGAIGGCVAGHSYNKHQRKAAAQAQSSNASQQGNGYQQGNGSQQGYDPATTNQSNYR
jgi:hypothetical protein